jgi:hypothetical protein
MHYALDIYPGSKRAIACFNKSDFQIRSENVLTNVNIDQKPVYLISIT